MLAVSDGFLAALASPQQVIVRADVSKGGVRLASNLPVIGGRVLVDRTAVTRRRLTLELAPRRSTGVYSDAPTLPERPWDPLGNIGQEITCQWGLQYVGGATEWLPLGVFRIEEPRGSLLSDGPVTITGVSREAHIADARFTSPRTVSGPSAQGIIAQLIHDVLPSAAVLASATMDRRVPTTTFDRDRWDAITTLADSIGATVYADPWGRFVIEDAATATTHPVWTVAAGPGGVLVSADASSSRARVYNGIVVEGQAPSSDSAPVRALAVDNRVGSPTRWGDPDAGYWGMRTRYLSLPTVTTTEQAQAVADAVVLRYTGAASTLDVSSVPNPALEAGDVIDIITDPTRPATSLRRHVVDTPSIPLLPGGQFPMTTRDVGDGADE